MNRGNAGNPLRVRPGTGKHHRLGLIDHVLIQHQQIAMAGFHLIFGNPGQLGDIIDECLNGHSAGRGLGRTFPVADRLENRVLVSTKSLDLDARSYQTPGRLRSRLNKYVKDLEGFEDKYLNKVDSEGHKYMPWKEGKFTENKYDSKVLEVVFPDTAIGNDVVEALMAFQRERAGTGIRIVYKIAK